MKIPADRVEQLAAKRLRVADLPALVTSGGVQLLSIDAPPAALAASAKTVGVVALPTPTPVSPTLAEVIAEHVVERLHALGASVTITGAQVTSPKLSASSESAPVPAPAPHTEVSDPPPLLLTTAMAARLLGCSVKALYHRVTERRIPSSCIVRSGRRLLFHRTKLLEAMDRRAGQR